MTSSIANLVRLIYSDILFIVDATRHTHVYTIKKSGGGKQDGNLPAEQPCKVCQKFM